MAGRYRPFYANDPDNVDARLSFPSGHASTSFSGMTFLSLYLFGKTRVFSEHSGATFPKLLGCISPFFVAAFISVSRTMDYHHNFSDILAGAVIGVLSGFLGYFLYYPSLFAPHSEQPRRKVHLQRHQASGETDSPNFRQVEEDVERAMSKNQFTIEVEDD